MKGKDEKMKKKFKVLKNIATITSVITFTLLVSVGCSIGKGKDDTTKLDEAVSKSIIEKGKDYEDGEFTAEGHIILDNEKKGNQVTVYSVATVGNFAFENSIFTKISGSGVIPTVIKYEVTNNGEYKQLDYKEPLDGDMFSSSLKELFPGDLYNKVKKTDEYSNELKSKEENQAKEYLKTINRDANVSADYVEKNLLKINLEAANALLEKEELRIYPYWVGTIERIEDGKRFIYETKQSKDENGNDLVTYSKSDESGKIINEIIYKIEEGKLTKIK